MRYRLPSSHLRCLLTTMPDALFQGAEHSALYAKFRPVAPPSLVSQIIKYHAGSIDECVDVGCGSGQFTKLILPHVQKRVIGQDVSDSQIAQAREKIKDPKAEFSIGGGETIGVKDQSIDLVTVAQALHWIQVDKFYAEVNRILKPGGVLAVIGYHFTCAYETEISRTEPNPERPESLRGALNKIYRNTGPYWAYERQFVDSGYRDIPGPSQLSDMVRQDNHFIQIQASLQDWMGYVTTWSGYQTLRKKEGDEAALKILHEFRDDCLRILGKKGACADSIPLDLRTNFWLILYRKQ